MEKSAAYKSLLKQINATGSEKLSGYNTELLDDITGEEREEIEKLIWSAFYDRKDMDIAVLFPKLKMYDGVQALKDTVNTCIIPSEASMLIAFLIYNKTQEDTYLEIMRKNIKESNYHYSYISLLSYAVPDEKIYEVLTEAYKNCSDRVACGSAINGILYNKGYIKDINNIEEVLSMKKLRKILKDIPKEQRNKMLERFENGEFEDYKNEKDDL